MRARGQNLNLDYSHDIANCPQMIAKFSQVSLANSHNTVLEEEEEEYDMAKEFYNETLWLSNSQVSVGEENPTIGQINCNSDIKIYEENNLSDNKQLELASDSENDDTDSESVMSLEAASKSNCQPASVPAQSSFILGPKL